MHESDQTNFIGAFLERQVHALGSLKSLKARSETDKAKSVQVDVKPSPRGDKEADFSYLNLVGVRGWTRGFAARPCGPHCVRLSSLCSSVRTVYPQCAEASGWHSVSIGSARVSRIQILGVN